MVLDNKEVTTSLAIPSLEDILSKVVMVSKEGMASKAVMVEVSINLSRVSPDSEDSSRTHTKVKI